MKIIFVCQGFFIPLARLSEPYFYEIVGLKLSKWCSQTQRSIQKEERSNDERFMERVAKFARKSVVNPLLSIQDRSDSNQLIENGSSSDNAAGSRSRSKDKKKKKSKKSKRSSRSKDKKEKRRKKKSSKADDGKGEK